MSEPVRYQGQPARPEACESVGFLKCWVWRASQQLPRLCSYAALHSVKSPWVVHMCFGSGTDTHPANIAQIVDKMMKWRMLVPSGCENRPRSRRACIAGGESERGGMSVLCCRPVDTGERKAFTLRSLGFHVGVAHPSRVRRRKRPGAPLEKMHPARVAPRRFLTGSRRGRGGDPSAATLAEHPP